MAYAISAINTPHIAGRLPVQCPAEQSVTHAFCVPSKCSLALLNGFRLCLCQGLIRFTSAGRNVMQPSWRSTWLIGCAPWACKARLRPQPKWIRCASSCSSQVPLLHAPDAGIHHQPSIESNTQQSRQHRGCSAAQHHMCSLVQRAVRRVEHNHPCPCR